MELALQFLALFVGIGIGLLASYMHNASKRTRLRERLAVAEDRVAEDQRLREENITLKIQQAQSQKEHQLDSEKARWVEEAQQRLREAFEALASKALRSNADAFLKRSHEQLNTLLTGIKGDWGTQKEEVRNLVQPLEKTLATMDIQLRTLEEKREGAYRSLEQHLASLSQAHTQLRDTTVTLAQALRSSTVRGQWGEFQLRRVVELAGMTANVDFAEQVTTDKGRPDMIVYLPNKGILPVDAKTPMQAYFDAVKAKTEEERKMKLRAHVQAIRQRVRELGRKQYWAQFEQAPEILIMFVPSEPCLAAAFELDAELLESAISRHILIATPLSLLGLLRAVAYGWQQHEIADNAQQIARQGQELYERIVTFVHHLQNTGKCLGQTINAYDAAVGSLQQRLLPAARRFKELNAETKDLPEPLPIERKVRHIPPTNPEE